MTSTRLAKIVSGGQTGVDRAALDTARRLKIPIGGWVPLGRRAEDGVVPAEFTELRETATAAWDERTELNVRDSDGTLILSHGPLVGGSALTLQCAERLKRPVLHLDLAQTLIEPAVHRLLSWLRTHQIATLNVAGPRASEDPQAYQATAAVLSGMLTHHEEPETSLAPLRALLDKRVAAGVVEWIGIRPARGEAVVSSSMAELLTQRGVAGDIATAREAGKRQVSLIQAEHLPVIASLLHKERVEPEALRRNLVVRGINLVALRNRRFRIGSAILEGSGPCEPCSKMERALGVGGYNAMRGHGGILARVIEGAVIRVGDSVDFALE